MPTAHTRLINYLIGFCKNDPKWISPLRDLKYTPHVIEQTITMVDGSKVIPDIIFGSNKYGHVLVCECKGGTTVSAEQAARYERLTTDDLSRWVRLRTGRMTHDVCYAMLEHNGHESIQDLFPILLFSDHVGKHGKNFKLSKLERKFLNAINISGLKPPLSYYPFSDKDERHEIAAYVIRAVMSLARKKDIMAYKSSQQLDKILRETHKMYEVLSPKHQGALKTKIKCIVDELAWKYPDFKKFLDGQSSTPAAQSSFLAVCQQIQQNIISTTRLDDFSDRGTALELP